MVRTFIIMLSHSMNWSNLQWCRAVLNTDTASVIHFLFQCYIFICISCKRAYSQREKKDTEKTKKWKKKKILNDTWAKAFSFVCKSKAQGFTTLYHFASKTFNWKTTYFDTTLFLFLFFFAGLFKRIRSGTSKVCIGYQKRYTPRRREKGSEKKYSSFLSW